MSVMVGTFSRGAERGVQAEVTQMRRRVRRRRGMGFLGDRINRMDRISEDLGLNAKDGYFGEPRTPIKGAVRDGKHGAPRN